MSIPMPLDIVVVSKNSDVAGIAAAILREDYDSSYSPHICAATTTFSTEKPPFFMMINGKKINIEVATSYQLMDARRIDIWLALDSSAAKDVRTYIMHNGPPPNNFYRGAFPDPVVPCGFDIPYRPSTKKGFDEWLNFLTENLRPWKERIWDIYRDSS
jgi:hypothetical protein